MTRPDRGLPPAIYAGQDEEVAMPHTKLPPAWAREHEFVPGAQWAASADWSTSRTSSQFVAGRGFASCGPNCAIHQHDALPVVDTDAIISRVLARLKLSGAVDAPDILKH